MNHISSSPLAAPITSLHARLPKAELVIVDRARLLEQLLRLNRFERRGPVWLLHLLDGGATIVTVEETVVTFTFVREEKRIAVGNQLIEAAQSSLAWPTLSAAA